MRSMGDKAYPTVTTASTFAPMGVSLSTSVFLAFLSPDQLLDPNKTNCQRRKTAGEQGQYGITSIFQSRMLIHKFFHDIRVPFCFFCTYKIPSSVIPGTFSAASSACFDRRSCFRFSIADGLFDVMRPSS